MSGRLNTRLHLEEVLAAGRNYPHHRSSARCQEHIGQFQVRNPPHPPAPAAAVPAAARCAADEPKVAPTSEPCCTQTGATSRSGGGRGPAGASTPPPGGLSARPRASRK